jgi:hypothetical protein
MNVHLLRSEEVSKDLYWDIIALLKQFNGPIQYISSDSFVDYQDQVFSSEIIRDEEEFAKKNLFDEKVFSLMLSYPYEREIATWKQLFEKCKQYRQMYDIGQNEIVVLLTDIANDKNWFMAMADNMKDAFIHTKDWEFYVDADPKYPIAYQVVELILHIHMGNSRKELFEMVHQHPVGCISDFVEDKRDISLKLRTADICLDCQAIIQKKNVPSGLVNQVLNTIEAIRQQMLFKERFKYHLKPSRMRFNLLHRKAIMLDIQGMTISLTPLEATIYYFFLKNNEGVKITDFYKYEQELFDIYGSCSVANSDNNIAAMRNSIKALIDPLENSLNEKISKIKSKFIKYLGQEMAENYYIYKDKTNLKHRIRIDRNLVELVG